VRLGALRQGRYGELGFGGVRFGGVRYGEAGSGVFRHGRYVSVLRGVMGHGMLWYVLFCFGSFWQARHGWLRCVAFSWFMAKYGLARFGNFIL